MLGGLGKAGRNAVEALAEVPLRQGIFVAKAVFPAKAVRPWCDGPRRDFGGFRFTEEIFSSNSWTREPCPVKHLDPGPLRTLRRMNQKFPPSPLFSVTLFPLAPFESSLEVRCFGTTDQRKWTTIKQTDL